MASPPQVSPRSASASASTKDEIAAVGASAAGAPAAIAAEDAFVDVSINLRDIAAALPATCPTNLRTGRVYRHARP